MRTLLTRVTAFYGANPLHLLALLGSFALAGYAALQLLGQPMVLLMAAWFLGAVIGHDLVLFPLYALADRSLRGALRAVTARRRRPVPRVSPVNHVRVPVLGTALTFLLFFPGIIQQGESTHVAASGLTQDPYLERWLLLVAAMFLISAIVYAIQVGRVSRSGR